MNLPSFILIQETQQKFGHHPLTLKHSSIKDVLVICSSCNEVRKVQFRNALKSKNGFCAACNGAKNGSARKLDKSHYETFIEMLNSQDLDSNECMPWTINKPTKEGYGTFRSIQDNKTYFPHIEALKTQFGREIKDGHICQQTCGNRLCFKLTHLKEVTWSENLATITGRILDKPIMRPSILIQETINEFGYSPEDLSIKSEQSIFVKCIECQEIRLSVASSAFESITQLCKPCSNRRAGQMSAPKLVVFNLQKANEHLDEKYGFITTKSFFSKTFSDGTKAMFCIGLCDCGNEVESRFSDIKRRPNISCGKCDSNPNIKESREKFTLMNQQKSQDKIDSLLDEYTFEFRKKSYKVYPVRRALKEDFPESKKHLFGKHTHYIMRGCLCDENKEWITQLTTFINGDKTSCGCVWKQHLLDPLYIYAIRHHNTDGAKMTLRSAPEVIFALALNQAQISYDYEPHDINDVIFNGKETVYIPDFRINGNLYEIKYNRDNLRAPESIDKFHAYLEQHKIQGKLIDKQELQQLLTIPLYKFCNLLWDGIEPNKNDVKMVDLRNDIEKLELFKSFIKTDYLKEILKINLS